MAVHLWKSMNLDTFWDHFGKIAFKITILQIFKYICLNKAGWGKQRNTEEMSFILNLWCQMMRGEL